MSSRRRPDDGVLITSARHGQSLDTDARQRRYLWSMAVRTVLFVAMMVVPGMLAKLACLAGAVLLPAAAVLLANDVDRRTPPHVEDHSDLPALLPGEVVKGEVVDGDILEER